MQPETPAQGILKINEWGNSKMYKAVCSCGDDACSHIIDIEADSEVNVTIYTRTKTNFWSVSRWRHIWSLLTRGHATFETTIILDRQSALNYAETIKMAIKDVETFEKERKNETQQKS
jgi:hypothetical protein